MARQWTLRVEEGDGHRDVPLPPEASVLGRADTATVKVTEPRASREHVRLEPGADGVVIRDLGSTNGTYVGDRRVLNARLGAGDRFRIGSTTFEVVSDESAPVPRRSGSFWKASFSVIGPALVVSLLIETVVLVVGGSHDRKLADARRELVHHEFSAASAIADPSRSEAALKSYLLKHPDGSDAAEARSLLKRRSALVDRIQRARRDLKRIVADVASGGVEASEGSYRLEKLLLENADLDSVSGAIEAALKQLDARRHRDMKARVDDVVSRSKKLLASGRYSAAISSLTSFVDEDPGAVDFGDEIEKAEDEAVQSARQAFLDLMAQARALAEKGEQGEAAKLLKERVARFNGTSFEIPVDLMVERLSPRTSKASVEPRSASERPLGRKEAGLIRTSRELAHAGRFARAASACREAAKNARDDARRAALTARAQELQDLGELVAEVVRQVRKKGRAFGEVTLDGEPTRVRELTKDGRLDLYFDHHRISRRWDGLRPEEVVSFLRVARLSPKQRILVADYCFERGLVGAFQHQILADLGVPDLREAAGRLYARKEAVPYPEGGYFAYRGRILTRAQHAEEVHRDRVAALRKDRADLFSKLQAAPVFARELARMRQLRAKLDKAREYALSLIFDEKKYFYPYQGRMKEYMPVQREVDRRVAAVRKIWNSPFKVRLTESSDVKRLLARIGKVDGELESLGVGTKSFERQLRGLTVYLGLTLTVRTYFENEAERQLFRYDDAVERHNATMKTVATAPEKKEVAITNAYRVMMGRRALVMDNRLVKCARGHSKEMSDEGYFSHFSPHPDHRTPSQRMALAGYHGNPESENIHRGSSSPEGAHNSWLHSSGHHRNILQKFWTDLGVGQSGRYWTQNFGRTHLMKMPPKSDQGSSKGRQRSN